jgi:SPP1 family predicted phage head-tail adaptor
MAKRELPYGGAIPMDPGERDRPVTIQQRASSAAGTGFPVETWTTLISSTWMRKIDLKGQERMQAGQLAARFDTMFEMAYRVDMDPELVDVTTKRRLVYQGRVYDIVAASQIGRREGVELSTLAGGPVS